MRGRGRAQGRGSLRATANFSPARRDQLQPARGSPIARTQRATSSGVDPEAMDIDIPACPSAGQAGSSSVEQDTALGGSSVNEVRVV
jgi:hypothetical protein